MTKLFIPTRNRPTSLAKILQYLVEFFPHTEVIVADGSADFHKEQNISNFKTISTGLSIDYRSYPSNLGMLERCLDVLRSLDDELIIWGADDDYPNMVLLERGAAFLAKNPDYVAATGATIKIMKKKEGILHKLSVARPIQAARAEVRMKAYSQWSFPTTYAVVRRSHIFDRLKRLSSLGQPGFFDFITGLHDVYKGKIQSYADIAFFATYIPNHARLKTINKLDFLNKSSNVLAIHESIVKDLESLGYLGQEDVDRIAQKIILNRISELSGWGFKKSVKFLSSKYYLDKIVKEQFVMYDNLLQEGTDVQKRYFSYLKYIYEAMREIEVSDDNQGEPSKHTRESICL
ncbi:TIGR00180 family glycosyltransferase [Desulfobotulus sp. H1]|uniref:TIGR00180 family glycosyltransferase n=1 Tax=Desulfobotulus pelophilus TaxID=2823377 RepID=A0ABT3ND74_9BACT|nr:TIGR00180 family glycosyltransferase [Desulfobotulus pelophilus]MCW7755403.1 TIGR00180 family glycosyltransferase [Desulfobotulus pelophilus]